MRALSGLLSRGLLGVERATSGAQPGAQAAIGQNLAVLVTPSMRGTS